MKLQKNNKNFWLLTSSELILQAGNHFRIITVTVFTFNVTNSILFTAIQYLLHSLPGFFFSGFAGRLADKINSRIGLTTVSIISGLVTLMYLITEQIYAIFFLNFFLAFIGLLGGFMRNIWLPKIVGREEVIKANGIRASLGGIIDIIFPLLVGLFIASLGTEAGFSLNSISFGLAALGFFIIRELKSDQKEKQEDQYTRKEQNIPSELQFNFKPLQFLKSQPDLIFLLVAYSVIVIPTQAISVIFLPFLKKQFGLGGEAFGAVISIFLLGNVISGYILVQWGNKISLGTIFKVILILPLVFFSYLYLINIFAFFFLVLINGVISIGLFTYTQSIFIKYSPEKFTGRVVAIFMTTHFAAEVFGAISGGILAEFFGFSVTFHVLSSVSFVILLVICIMYWRKNKKIQKKQVCH